LPEKTYAHFIGAGGAGMSAIALVLADRGMSVTGSDLKESRYTRALEAAGIHVTIGHAVENLGDPEVVVVSTDIPEKNPELVAARERGIEVWPRARMLGHLAGDRKTIAVAGTHGKTSTSSMVATMLARMGLDPTFLIGGVVDGFDSNAVSGAGEHYVVEADESDGSFLYLNPYVAIITNMEADHLDYYGTVERMEWTFCDFMKSVSPEGALVVCGDQEDLVAMARSTGRRVVTYGMSKGCDVRATILGREGLGLRFEVTTPDRQTATSVSTIPGIHMASNATSCLATAWALGLDLQDAARALSEFPGVRRRFTLLGEAAGVTVVDDYAHHPTEVRATLLAAQELDFERVVVVFQAHRYYRTELFSKEFGEALSIADLVVLLELDSPFEAPIPGVNGRLLLKSVLRARPRAQIAFLPHRADVVPYVTRNARPGDLLITMGAGGDVSGLGAEIVRVLSGDEAAETCP
jgi:UDP-N-acetylmuramate--alanine ligase